MGPIGNSSLPTDKESLSLPPWMPRKSPEMCNLKSELSPPRFFGKTLDLNSFPEYKLHKYAFHQGADLELAVACYQMQFRYISMQ